MDEQSIRFTEAGGRRVAWAEVGEGPPLVLSGWWMSHLELNWRDPAFRAFIAPLAERGRLIRYDPPGTGISDRDGPPPRTLEEEVAALAAVVEASGEERVDLLAASAGGPVALAFAAELPERVNRLVLYATYARGGDIVEGGARDSILAVVREHWGLGSRVLADLFMPSATEAQREAFVAFQRESASAELAAQALAAIYELDAGEHLSRVECEALVIHRRGDRGVPFALGQDLAARLSDATLVALEGADHLPWVGSVADVLRPALRGLGASDAEIEAALAKLPEDERPETELSDRELDVLRLVAMGLSDRDIAERLVLSPHTVHRHVANIRAKLRLPSRAAAAAHAARLGLL